MGLSEAIMKEKGSELTQQQLMKLLLQQLLIGAV
jgi:hypothetical protein